ncbi:MAG: SDR family NAD(P)-dependent oxidoreductase [Pseudomonadota bacterium]|nr:SDR family NAD(P)-dependent oxidoreductase [Pseudomonadota bacterium]
MPKPFADRIVIVTGASRGIGRACAVALAKAGAHVIAVARTQGALEELDDEIRSLGGTATLVPLDLKDMPALDRLGGSIFERWGRLDGFLGNAGMLGVLTPLSHLEPKAFDQTMAVNVAANWRLIRSFDPLLRQSDAGRVVFVTSGAAQKHTPFWGIYAASKAALESLALTYAAECVTTNVKVNLFNPGPLRTAMRAKAFPGEDPMALEPPEAVVPAILDLLSPACTKNGERIDFRAA